MSDPIYEATARGRANLAEELVNLTCGELRAAFELEPDGKEEAAKDEEE